MPLERKDKRLRFHGLRTQVKPPQAARKRLAPSCLGPYGTRRLGQTELTVSIGFQSRHSAPARSAARRMSRFDHRHPRAVWQKPTLPHPINVSAEHDPNKPSGRKVTDSESTHSPGEGPQGPCALLGRPESDRLPANFARVSSHGAAAPVNTNCRQPFCARDGIRHRGLSVLGLFMYQPR
jgi:hypothetical protein